jgi:hypothetical protein
VHGGDCGKTVLAADDDLRAGSADRGRDRDDILEANVLRTIDVGWRLGAGNHDCGEDWVAVWTLALVTQSLLESGPASRAPFATIRSMTEIIATPVVPIMVFALLVCNGRCSLGEPYGIFLDTASSTLMRRFNFSHDAK